MRQLRIWLGLLGLLLQAQTPEDVKWVDEVGGKVVRDASGRVTGVDLRGSWVSDTDLRKLAQLPYLEFLDLSLTRITDQGMQELKNARGIVELNLHYAEYVTDEGLAALKGWKKLKRLDVKGAKISDTTLEHISAITTLESLNIGSAMVTDVGIERLTSLPNLKELSVGGNELGDAGLHALRQLPRLTYLDLSGRQGTDSNVWSISMSEVGFESVLTLKDLRELKIACSDVGIGVEGTRFATVSNINVTDRWLEKLKALPKLEKLTLLGCSRVNDEAIRPLTALPNLRELDVKGSPVTDKGVATLRSAKPKVQVYYGPWQPRTASFRNN
jgi:Leucine-rich repeat (LRR) protein